MKARFIIPDETRREQSRASDPETSAWVSANAGSGKTHVLAQRVIRLLLDGVDPSKILCLTYTRAAASNMANRIFETLAKWTRLDDEGLAEAIAETDGKLPSATVLKNARRLFARALETPGGLKIQTIHAFCEAVLHQFPLEANIAGHFELLEGSTEAALVAEARRDLITGAAAGENVALADAFAHVLSIGNEFGLDGLLEEIVRNRDGLRHFIGEISDGSPRFTELFEEFGFLETDNEAGIASSAWPLPGFDPGELRALLRVAEEEDAKSVLKNISPGVARALSESDPILRLEHLCEGFLKATGDPYEAGKAFKKAMYDRLPDLAERYQAAAKALLEAADRLALFRSLLATRAALVIADWLIVRYEQLKAARGFLDFNDLIERTIRLLSRSDAGAWVQYKLDRGIDHILIDEAQDTSPVQWQVVKKLAEEFFAGFSARERARRTIFAVGDEKQSIYSFQGARPEEFDMNGHEFSARVIAAERRFERVRLQRSFRSTGDILSAVDLVFTREAVREGLTRDPEMIEHKPIREGAPGYVEVWPTIGETAIEQPEDWRVAIDHASQPAVRVAEAIAETIENWIKSGDTIEGTGKKLTAGDVMVLVRKRGSFVHAISRSLKNRHIPVAGADRLRLQDHIAVRDLMALGRFVLQPEDDLSLAALLKSPIFGLSEEALFTLASSREKRISLFERLKERARKDEILSRILTQLLNWRAEADFKPVFEFYATILARDGVRRKIISRLGHEAGEILDEFLGFCLDGEKSGLPGLEAFLATLEMAGPEIKREMDQMRDEVRIMTVHAAKGLEAPVVFLVDGGNAPFSRSHLPRLIPFAPPRGGWHGNGYIWRAGSGTSSTFLKRLEAEAARKAEEEYRRLLYVGMTRAEDRLIVCGYYGKKAPGDMTWHRIVRDALSGAGCGKRPSPFEEGEEPIYRYCVTAGSIIPVAEPGGKVATADTPVMPEKLLTPLPAIQRLPRPLAPSGASILIEADGQTSVRPSPVLSDQAPAFALERGTTMHRLLQVLPQLAVETRKDAAERYLARVGAKWPEGERQRALEATFRILDDDRFSPLFAEDSRAEVSIMGTLTINEKERAISGKIDRLTVSGGKVLILDYKTNRVPPVGLSEIPEAYILQMALYRELLKPLYPGKAIEAALLFTETPRLVPLPSSVMDGALARLNKS
ncbi:MAG TPA: double-strand break repair helicase AddA [Rhizobiaceae bacterium]|nr:double-strand break repair helicase AddA [Rhizobiaceae bacterium]